MASRRWFHQYTCGEEAEQLLMERGTHGSFLCRWSSDRQGYTLSFRRKDSVTHIKVQNTGDKYRLYDGEQFPTLSALIQHYMENELRESTGELIELKYPVNSKDPTSERWFHGHMTSKEAERLLLDKGKNGSYLVRESTRQPGDYALTIRSEDVVRHVMVRNVKEKFDVGGGVEFDTIAQLVEHYKQLPMVEKNGTVVHLVQPVNTTKMTGSLICDRVVMLQKADSTLVPGKDGFWEEFEQLQQQEHKQLYSRKIGIMPENKHKNRFKNIVPFDHTRVFLVDGDPDSPVDTYINASYIDGESEHEYIATQGCLPETLFDFWRMVYYENTCILLMLNKEYEKGKKRCEKYWPDVKTTINFRKFQISNVNEQETPQFICRTLKLLNKEEPEEPAHTIYQYQYTCWPDHGVPTDVGSVLGILHDINLKQKAYNYPGPIVVQCSSGVGRTGAIIAIDILVQILQKQGHDCEIDIQKTVQLIRTQRPGMVQLEAQYKLIYLAVAQYVEMDDKLRVLSQNEAARNPIVQKTDVRKPPAKVDVKRNNKPIRSTHTRAAPPTISINGEPPPPIPQRKPPARLVPPLAQPATHVFDDPSTPPPIPTRKKPPS